MVDSLLSSIATFHTTKIIVTDPTKFSYIASIPETMLGCISATSNLLHQYRKRKAKEGPITKPSKGQTPNKRKSDKAAPSQPQPKKQKKPARKLILQSSSSSNSEYVPPRQKNTPSSDSENKCSDEEDSGRGDTPPRSPTPEILVRSFPPSPPPVTIPSSIPPISQTTTSQPFTSKPIPTPIFTDTTSTTTTKPTFTIPNPPVTEPTFTTEHQPTTEPPTTSKPLSPTPSTETTPILGGEDFEFDSTYFSPYRVQSEDDDDEPITKHHLKEAAAGKNAATVTSSVETLQHTLQSECSKVEAARLAIQQANDVFHANVNECLSQLQADLAMENGVMDELARRTNQLKLQTHKL
ncbi:hypothetical protein Lser_V15G04357 [Lactuca serriola]